MLRSAARSNGQGQKKYLFDCSDITHSLPVGTKVVCETARGLAPGVVATQPFYLPEEMVLASGAYLPLKKVLRIFGDVRLLEAERKLIAKKYFDETLFGFKAIPGPPTENEMPF